VKLGVVAALPHELAPTLKVLLATVRPVEHLKCHESPPFVFTVGGIGDRRAAAAALLVADTFKPDAILSVGFCGALRDDFETADLILGGTTALPASEAVLDLARAAAPKARTGAVLTVTKVILSAEEKRAAATKTGAAVVDMEAEAVAKAARARGVGFLSVKVVIDTPAEPLASSYTGCWTVLKEIVFRPGTVTQMMYDSRRCKLAADRLRDFFVALKEKIPTT
jgi:adenosylhomocysteine nucleosidase